MLFHITATHTTENCPGYHRERMPEVIAAMENLETLAKELDCWQSAQVGQIRTREDYYYEELRGSSLRVLL